MGICKMVLALREFTGLPT